MDRALACAGRHVGRSEPTYGTGISGRDRTTSTLIDVFKPQGKETAARATGLRWRKLKPQEVTGLT
jgi:hypothetical protein